MADPWNYAGPVTQLGSGADAVTLVDESTFAISGGAGDISPGAAQGLFFRDTRILSQFEVLVNGARAEPLAAVTDDPFSATFVARDLPAPGRADSTPHGVPSPPRGPGHARGAGCSATSATRPRRARWRSWSDADFADLFAVKEGGWARSPATGR